MGFLGLGALLGLAAPRTLLLLFLGRGGVVGGVVLPRVVGAFLHALGLFVVLLGRGFLFWGHIRKTTLGLLGPLLGTHSTFRHIVAAFGLSLGVAILLGNLLSIDFSLFHLLEILQNFLFVGLNLLLHLLPIPHELCALLLDSHTAHIISLDLLLHLETAVLPGTVLHRDFLKFVLPLEIVLEICLSQSKKGVSIIKRLWYDAYFLSWSSLALSIFSSFFSSSSR